MGAAAFADGVVDVVPFVDIRPFENRGFYDSCQYGLGISRAVGGVTRDTALFLGGAAAWRAVPVLGGGQISTQASLGLSGAGLTPVGVAFTQSTAGSQAAAAASYTGSFALTQGARLSSVQNLVNESRRTSCND